MSEAKPVKIEIEMTPEAARQFVSACAVARMTDNAWGPAWTIAFSIAARITGEREGPIRVERFRG